MPAGRDSGSVKAGPACGMSANLIPIPLPAGIDRGGWFLLKGVLYRRGGDYDARLYYDVGGSFEPPGGVQIGASARGALSEVLRLPPGVRRIALDPGRSPFAVAEGIHLEPMAPWRSRLRMFGASAAQLWSLRRTKRRVAGLSLLAVVRDPATAYGVAKQLRPHAAAPAYEDWVKRFDTLDASDKGAILACIRSWQQLPDFHILVLGENQEGLARTRKAIEGQLYPRFTWADACAGAMEDGGSASLAPAADDWLLVLRAGDVIPPHALFWFASTILQQPQARFIYADEDRLDAAGRRVDPQFKPDWSLVHARSAPFTGRAAACHAQSLLAAGGWPRAASAIESHDAALRLADAVGEDAIVHIPAILLHGSADPLDEEQAPFMESVRRHLVRRGDNARVEPGPAGTCRVRPVLPPEPPLVSIIVPTRDALELTRRCLETLHCITSYPRYEVLLVDNGSRDEQALAWMREQAASGRLRLLRHEGPFNFAGINNEAVQQAKGELVCLLNNDTEIIQAGWLEAMVEQLLQPGVEVVGAKLLYADGCVQHAGDLVGVGGVANHAFCGLPGEEPGYCRRAVVAQEYSAVTAACLLVRRDCYLALGGLDAEHVAISFNDVDFCLRVRERGGRVAWTPHAVLVHHESVSRGKDLSRARRRQARREASYMRRRWGLTLARDPFYNPNLTLARADFSLSAAPVVAKPWLP